MTVLQAYTLSRAQSVSPTVSVHARVGARMHAHMYMHTTYKLRSTVVAGADVCDVRLSLNKHLRWAKVAQLPEILKRQRYPQMHTCKFLTYYYADFCEANLISHICVSCQIWHTHFISCTCIPWRRASWGQGEDSAAWYLCGRCRAHVYMPETVPLDTCTTVCLYGNMNFRWALLQQNSTVPIDILTPGIHRRRRRQTRVHSAQNSYSHSHRHRETKRVTGRERERGRERDRHVARDR